jgi:hypothetical protein
MKYAKTTKFGVPSQKNQNQGAITKKTFKMTINQKEITLMAVTL